MSSSSRRFDYLSWPAAQRAACQEGSTLIWPFGACEQHGPHLPLATDTLFAELVAERVLERLPSSFPVWRLPGQAFGFSPEHSAFPGTISMTPEWMLQLVMEVGRQMGSMGIRRLLLFNAHGGQIGLLQAAARQLHLKCPEMSVMPCFLWSGVDSLRDLLPSKEREEGLHAALAETSLMLSLNPDLVGDERPIDGDHSSCDRMATPPEGWSLEGPSPCAWLTKELSSTGVIGDSRGATASLGALLEKALIDHWVELLTSLMESNWPPSEGR